MATDFGTDMSGATDLTPTLLDISGLPLMQQVICRRLFTPLGSLLSDPAAITCDLREFMSTDLPRRPPNVVRSTAMSALLDDPRIFSAAIVIDWKPDEPEMRLTITGEGSTGPFQLTLAVTAVTVQVLG